MRIASIALASLLCLGCMSSQERAALESDAEQLRQAAAALVNEMQVVRDQLASAIAKAQAGDMDMPTATLIIAQLNQERQLIEQKLKDIGQEQAAIADKLKGRPWYEQLEGLIYVIGAIAGNTALSRARRGVNVLTGKPKDD